MSDSVAAVYSYTIDSLRADNLSGGSIFSSKSEVIYNLDEEGKPKPFNIRYPAIFRIGASYKKMNIKLALTSQPALKTDYMQTHAGNGQLEPSSIAIR